MLPEPREGQTPPGEGQCAREIPAQDLVRAKSQERTIRFASLENVPDPGKQAVLRPGAWRSRTRDTHRVLLLLLVKARDTGAACQSAIVPVAVQTCACMRAPHTHTQGNFPATSPGKQGA